MIRRLTLARALLALALVPPAALALLALAGARADVGVLTSGAAASPLLGAAWVACWLAATLVSPSLAASAALAALLGAAHRYARARHARRDARVTSSSEGPPRC